jgi:hypothetical protein
MLDDKEYEVGVTAGAPAAGQGTFQHNDFIGKKVRLIRDGLSEYTLTGAASYYTFNSSTGTFNVVPDFVDGERLRFEIYGINANS